MLNIVNIISLILVFVEITLEMKIISGIFILPYLLYLCNDGRKNIIFNIIFIVFLYSLQNNDFYVIFMTIFSIYLIYYLLLSHLHYKKENIMNFVIIQLLILTIVYWNHLSVSSYLYNCIGLSLVNYIYIEILKRKKMKL
jgi:hypothetical protein